MRFLGLIPQRFLGIDIGTSAIKLVEVSSWAGRKKLENYGEISASALYEKPFRTFEKSTLSLSSQDISRAIKAIIEESKIKSKKAIFSIPDFSTFFTTFKLPPMSSTEIPQAVRSEAMRHVPVPLGEVTLDWQLLSKVTDQATKDLEVLLVTVPNEVINQYREIAEKLGLELLALEAEVFGLVRALIDRDDKDTVALVDIGARSTTCSIIDKRTLKISHSFDISGNDLTERISKALSIDYKKAEDLKKKHGILSAEQDLRKGDVKEVLLPLIDLIISEINKVLEGFYSREKKEVKRIILAGGESLLPGLLEYLRDYFKKEVKVANPFSKIFFPPILDKTLEEMGPSYTIALGMALRGLED
ncbi:MAG: type IV pilus assembly protein PilM [Patescibacteria group bacterium]|nr:type IV pilus assembly protein PilM [Patescibacteria group bacterium]